MNSTAIMKPEQEDNNNNNNNDNDKAHSQSVPEKIRTYSSSSEGSSSATSSTKKNAQSLHSLLQKWFWKDPDFCLGAFMVSLCVVLCFAVNQQDDGTSSTEKALSDATWFAVSCFGPRLLIPWIRQRKIWRCVALLILWTIWVPVNIGDAIWRFVAGSATSLSILTVMDFGQWNPDVLQTLTAGQLFNNLLMLVDCTQPERFQFYHQLWTWKDTQQVAAGVLLKIPLAIWMLHRVQAQYNWQEEQLLQHQQQLQSQDPTGSDNDNDDFTWDAVTQHLVPLLPLLPLLPWIMLRCFLAGFVACEALTLIPKQYGLLGYYAIKIKHPPVMKDPYHATSLTDFWGRRWDVVIQERLKRAIYNPLRRQWKAPKNLCVVLVFCASGLLHVFILAAGGLVQNDKASLVSCMAFFVLQAPLMSLEVNLFGKEEQYNDKKDDDANDTNDNDTTVAPSTATATASSSSSATTTPTTVVSVLRRIYLVTCIFVTTPLLLEPILRANPRL
mmetsp:Transcript_5876/g.14983  ORF Transcript_5876/g.14983 Transcript_5876/m.14983 type:complete len:499 (+) Transcript_5876:111-1607(+)